MDSIEEILHNQSPNNLLELSKKFEEYEIVCAFNGAMEEFDDELYSIYLLSYIYSDDIIKAKHLWKRIPKEIKDNGQYLKITWELTRYLYERNMQDVNRILSLNWPERFKKLIESLLANLHKSILDLVSSSYENISIQKLSSSLGLNESETMKVCTTREWTVNENSFLVYPKRIELHIPRDVPLDQLQQLAEYVLFLEQKSTF